MFKYVLGVDASSINLGWAVFDYELERLVRHGRVSFNPEKNPYYFRLANGARRLFEEVDLSGVEVLAIEHSFFTKNAKTGKAITMIIGSILYEGMNRGINEVIELSPTEIKKAFALHGLADKDAMRQSAMFEFGVDLSEDETDAAAAAFCFTQLHKRGEFERRANLKREKAYNAAQIRKAKEAAKKGKSLAGELTF